MLEKSEPVEVTRKSGRSGSGGGRSSCRLCGEVHCKVRGSVFTCLWCISEQREGEALGSAETEPIAVLSTEGGVRALLVRIREAETAALPKMVWPSQFASVVMDALRLRIAKGRVTREFCKLGLAHFSAVE